MLGKTVGIEGWTIVHSARQKHYDDRFYGQFLGIREDGRWIVGRMWSGESMDDGFHDGGWDWSKRFAGNSSTGNADAALKAYVEMSYDTYVWDRVFEQRVGEAIDRHWAGPEVPGAPSSRPAGSRAMPATVIRHAVTRSCCRSTRRSTSSCTSCGAPSWVRRRT
ncbi:hypothetical protein N7U49_21285 [Streptomyces sp. AD2-2]|nr:hypothetical protein N7U49_21285 [Streptomyces sp. AD2-2]